MDGHRAASTIEHRQKIVQFDAKTIVIVFAVVVDAVVWKGRET